MITLYGLHPKGLRNGFCLSRRELAEKLNGIIPSDTLNQYLANPEAKRYKEPPMVTKVACYAVYQALIDSGNKPLNVQSVNEYLIQV